MIKRFIIIQPKIDFKVMGIDQITSDYLNWCMQQRDNLEFIKECKTLERPSSSFVGHLDHMSMIKRIDDNLTHTRT
jgi:hypothetical protein